MEASAHDATGFLRRRYDRLWTESSRRIRSGAVEIDPTLAACAVDRRRGMTLIFRPSPTVQRRIAECQAVLRELEPGQHFYHADELHVTFLTLFTATEDSALLLARRVDYEEAVAHSVQGLGPFTCAWTGLTASSAAIMVQGFTNAVALNAARDRLRSELKDRGLSEGLDTRYRLETAHMTIARFRQPLRNGPALAEALESRRDLAFGEMVVEALELVTNDWYLSQGCTQILRRYELHA